MRVILIGPPADRARLRRALADTSIDIVDEAATVADAQREGADADAFLVTAAAADRGDDEDDAPHPEALTPREREVLQLLAEGLPNKAIARVLGISDQTVKFHVAAICGKLGAANRTDAVRRAFQRGLVTV
jgi:two-component system, NarL family, nitrate/nitrite response regulator NarL